jgi:hypothetical protein
MTEDREDRDEDYGRPIDGSGSEQWWGGDNNKKKGILLMVGLIAGAMLIAFLFG